MWSLERKPFRGVDATRLDQKNGIGEPSPLPRSQATADFGQVATTGGRRDYNVLTGVGVVTSGVNKLFQIEMITD